MLFGWCGLRDEVAGARADIEVATRKVRAVVLDEPWDGHMQDSAGHEDDDPRVVDREHERVVSGLALVGWITALHRSLLAPSKPMLRRVGTISCDR